MGVLRIRTRVQISTALLVASSLAAACGEDHASTDIVRALPVAARTASAASPALAVAAITAFGSDLFLATRASSPSKNVVVSPVSVAVALAMLEPGAVGDAEAQLRRLLRIDDPVAFHASMSALEQELEARTPDTPFVDDGDPGDLTLRLTSRAVVQRGWSLAAPYASAIGSAYGPVLHEADFAADPDGAAHAINALVDDDTNGLIPALIPDGVIKADTVLALVNALYAKASWVTPFEAAATTDGAFTRLDGSSVSVPMMHGGGGSSARGDGWVGATKDLVGGLAVQFILPDPGRFDEVTANLDAIVTEYSSAPLGGGELTLPRFEVRHAAHLRVVLQSIGLVAPFATGGLTDIMGDPELRVDEVLHEAVVTMDEEGIEAAAATVVLITAVSAPLTPVPVVLDRPFVYRIIDQRTGATLFIGQVTDPTG